MEQVFTKEAVEIALKLVALGTTGLVDSKYAEEQFKLLPKELSRMVMVHILAAYTTKKVVSESLDKLLKKPPQQNPKTRNTPDDYWKLMSRFTMKS